MKNKVAETLAINSGNMIASLNVQVAQLQVSHEEQEQQIKDLKTENNQLEIENDELRKKVNAHESSTNNTYNKQNRK